MPFDPVDSKQSFPDLEKGILTYWREEDVFKRSVSMRDCAPSAFSFYDGPPFATGLPHYGHLLAGTIKDVIPRYRTMRGERVERRFGWDCHGLPIENLVEKENNVKSKREIEEKGVAWFNDLCRGSVQRYTAQWRKAVERMGRWVDMDWDYRTMDPEYMESIWWVFKKLWEKGLIYEGHKAMHICPRCVTPLSNFEVTLGYRDVVDWGVTARFPLRETKETKEGETHILAWTTTAWTLPGNLFLAVNPEIKYVKFRYRDARGEQLCIASVDFYNKLHQDADNYGKIIRDGEPYQPLKGTYSLDGLETFPGSYLLGMRYQPLFPYFANQYGDNAFRVVDGSNFVVTTEGTGVVHVAPGFGQEDYEVGKRESVEVLSHVTMEGRFVDGVSDFAGEDVKPADNPTRTDKKIAAWLDARGKLFAQGPNAHSYPHCWRCESPLLNYATTSWFVKVEKIKKDLLKANRETRWVPEHIRDGRFGQWLANARDWAISRNRYWGTPLPIWRASGAPDGEKSQIPIPKSQMGVGRGTVPMRGREVVVIGSRDELMAVRPERFTKITVLRHGESEGNVVPVYQGEVPGTNLTRLGRKQAKAVGKQLKKRRVRTIYASPLARTRQTAEIIAGKVKASVVIDDRLREIAFGEHEGKTIDFSDLTFVRQRRAHKWDTRQPESIYHFPGMEKWESVQARIRNFFAETLPKHRGEHIVIVSHADPINNIRHFFTKEDPFKLSHRPYPEKAQPYTFFWDHERGAQLDLHRETVDGIVWGEKGKGKREKGMFQRVPEVLDCWFESGAMPYAQSHFPFEWKSPSTRPRLARPRSGRAAAKLPPGFPADFIAEGLDQTRGWFYTLMVLSTALFKKPAFRNCVVNGIVLAQDGRKMSKSAKNYPEPMEIVEKYGADAIRFTLVASPAVRGENLRFSENSVEENLRRVILPLWNAYAFFVTYANEGGWSHRDNHQSPTCPPKPRRRGVTNHQGSSKSQISTPKHPLDRWIIAEVQDLVNRMTEQLDRYDLSATCAELHDTLDALTNWYIRRSRRRFAGKTDLDSGSDERDCALATLHFVLLTFSKLLAPFCPFITEAIYLNLMPEEHGSIHLSDWPAVRMLTEEERALMENMRLLRAIVSLGMRLRAEANIKVRQPLSRADIVIPVGARHPTSPRLRGTSAVPLRDEDRSIIKDELNVKEARILSDPSGIADRVVAVDARVLGPRLGAKVQDVIRAAKAGEFTENRDGTVTILGETLRPDEARVVYRGKEGKSVASERGVVVMLDTTVTEELRLEGLTRDIIRAVQALRRERGLKVADQITLEASGGMDALLVAHRAYIEREVNGVFGDGDGDRMLCVTVGIEGEKVVAVA